MSGEYNMNMELTHLLPLIRSEEAGLATWLFLPHRLNLTADVEAKRQDLQVSGGWDLELQKATRDLEAWKQQSGREQSYTAESLAEARLIREMANVYEDIHSFPLNRGDTDHLALIREDMKQSRFRKILMAEGKGFKKLGLVELSARLLPALTFPGSSAYFEAGVLPYGMLSREAIGEDPKVSVKSFISAAVAEESAANLQRQFKVHYALAETSAAPRNDIPKSGKKPEIYICGLVGDTKLTQHQVIDTPFREEFNATARELMYIMLKKMYGAEVAK